MEIAKGLLTWGFLLKPNHYGKKCIKSLMEREMRIRNYSEKTIKSYLYMLHSVCRYYNLPPGRISNDQFKDYLYYLTNSVHCSVSTVNQAISVWKILQQDILCRKWEEVRVKRPRPEKRLPEVLSRQEAIALINAPKNLKHRTLLTLTYTTGARLNEVLSLTLKDIDRHRKIIRLKGKGNKDREVFMPDQLLELLESYYREYRPLKYLFESYVKGKRYSARSFEVIVKNAAIQSGINKNVYPHILRHSFATHMLEKGVNIKRVQLMLGHNSMKTTSIYLHLTNIDQVILPNLACENE